MSEQPSITERRAQVAAEELVFGEWGWSGQEVSVTVAPLDGTIFFTAALIDLDGTPVPGARLLVGPDAQVWVMSSNWSLHDPELTVQLLADAYSSGQVAYLDPEVFSNRVKAMTADRHKARRRFAKDLLAGSLRKRTPRRLP